MGHVVFVPTGVMELEGLCGAFQRLFPAHEFSCATRFGQPFHGFTTTRVKPGLPMDGTSNVEALVEVAFTKASASPHPELVVVLEDLELANADQASEVVACFRKAAGRAKALLGPRNARLAKERVSFHLAVPMIESWVFADPEGPSRAGAHRSSARSASDPEDFATNDPAYEADDGSKCTAWCGMTDARRKVKCRPGWLCTDRTRHPKAYLQWLCAAPGEKNCTTYAEAGSGAAALRAVDWPAVLATPGMTYLRALVADIAEALGEEGPHGAWPSEPADLTSYKLDDSAYVIRNI